MDINGNKWGKLTRIDGALIVMVAIGAVVMVASLFRGITEDGHVQVEFLDSASKTINEQDGRQITMLVVDIEGAVLSPGVYELPNGSRVKDALIAAGGFSEMADRSFCEKNLNLAQELQDGQKIYIPFVTNTPTDAGYAEANDRVLMVNLNTATVSELDTLWGVGPARAESIVKNRPYTSVEEAVSKGGISKQILEKNREKLVVY
ncbi:hypothetical protein A3K29_05605 [Candidatus Collierbacteria bacterium RIFOXYB2_FULL_46_14]|uniref:ComE operon protein 1 n=1 Tax=Candidatus Collierbacteria bacterium GW2011_GWA2_46_26 TaxID=1618381 RepID=A0A0G1PIU5_9BACT|nr:MAG: ComE operon protein 1 [Candidatus Collierbacteria bacterium GW2011_GWA2_46_26]OGD73564.1 MAG: hypothetical protein A3K29_05605 [Candidatus Collierbacteria bacterium RIFOXYB2_FULL_46_14]OGD76606.1 MAG: hypothetical protein A3K43_05605 [Candidatus Collierbacteria bacterium RIFOXYA2_FULL_46_20]OGD77942.1 MAG: hypothetical protein A3K39_05605 [Candidatus Collierbacteria bacterium RIFOXYC2_FULL_43_15]OGD79966.1 MAG: hypothetical protein A2320_00035 [Pseudomonadales bacterium GWC2_63_15]OGD8